MTRASRFISGFIAAAALAFCVVSNTSRAESGPPAAPIAVSTTPLTFNKDVAPILFQNCAECHHPGGPAPFSLMSYQDARRRAKQIVAVTESRYMPPWLPAPGYGDFIGARRLTDQQIATIKAWVEQGSAEGLEADLQPAPRFNEGWQLGQPDLVVQMARPYTLPAGCFFFQAEDGIRDGTVTGVQTCALPI